jgi:hypothetical protein
MKRASVQSVFILCAAFYLSAGGGEPDLTAPVVPPGAQSARNESLSPRSDSAPFDARDRYDSQQIEGWRILVNKKLRTEPELCSATLKLLSYKLYDIARSVPAPALAKLRRITFWVELKEPHTPCMCYHVDAGWLRDNGMNPEKAGCVEVANARNFLSWSFDQPWMVLHELSHGYHDQFLPDGYQNKEILAAYHHAMDAKLYDSVLRCGGRVERAYAATNQMEYFAESCEAFFGTNDFYPFVKTELQKHDPQCFETVKKVWGIDAARATN